MHIINNINNSMKHGAKNHSNTRKILNNNNVHTHAHTHPHPPPTHTHTHTHTLFFWLTNNLKHSINYNNTKFLKQNTKIETLNRPQHINYRCHLWSNILNPGRILAGCILTAVDGVYMYACDHHVLIKNVCMYCNGGCLSCVSGFITLLISILLAVYIIIP